MPDAFLALAERPAPQGAESPVASGASYGPEKLRGSSLRLVAPLAAPSEAETDEAGSRAAMLEQIPSLRRYARVLTRQADSADELVQECLLQALSRLHQWRRGTSIRPWLFSIMHNLHVNGLRRSRVRGSAGLEVSDVETSIQARQEDQAEVNAAFEALRQLPEEQQQVLRLIVIDDLSYRETAERLGVPIGTVMSRLARGRERLRVLLGDL